MITYTEKLGAILRLFDGAREPLHANGRTYSGIGQQSFSLQPPFTDGVPLAALDWLLGQDTQLRMAPFAGTPASPFLPMLVVLWRPLQAFVGRTHVVLPDGKARVTRALSILAPPTVLVDAAHEVWAGWALTTPITDATSMQAALATLATHVGGEPLGTLEERQLLPIGGIVRNWNFDDPTLVQLVHVDPARIYPSLDSVIGDRHVPDSGN